MAELCIQLTKNGNAQLCVSGSSQAWARVQQEVLGFVSFFNLVGGERIELPFWELLPLLPRIRGIHRAFELELKLSDEVRELIVRANRDYYSLRSTEAVREVTESDLVDQLSKVGFKRKLTTEQVRNVCKLASIPSGATFSVPGAGKTTEALALYAYKTGLKSKLLVVCPKNAFAAWEEQVAECLTGRNVVRLVKQDQISGLLDDKPDIAIITYSQLTYVTDIIGRYMVSSSVVMFLDESHKIKGGEKGAWAKSVLNLSALPEWKLLMSGTPMPNLPQDLLPQLRFLYPTISPDVDPISEIQPLYVRTTKEELKLPPVEAEGIPIPLTDAQARLYKLCKTEVARDAEIALKRSDKIALRQFGRSCMLLLQLVSNPGLLLSHSNKFSSEDLIECLQTDSPKIAYVCHRARELASSGQKVLIWSNFVQNVKLVSERLADLGADYICGEVETGSDDEDNTREWKIKRFHEDENAMVLVANPAACSEGISLHTVCHYAIYIDRNYNAAQFLQSQDRIHRLGLSKDTLTKIEYVFCPGTIDESVRRRLEFKVGQMELALKDGSIAIPTHWYDDMDELADADDIRDLLATLAGN